MKKIKLVGVVMVVLMLCVGVLSSFIAEDPGQKFAQNLSTDTGTDTDTDTGTGSDTEDPGMPPEPGMVFEKSEDKSVNCPAQKVTWTSSWTAGEGLIATAYSNGKIVKGAYWGRDVHHTTTGETTIDPFPTVYVVCLSKWGWGCTSCNPPVACTIGCYQ